MSVNESPPPNDVNWEAYSHEELYRMLWQDADVGAVSAVATEWTNHRAALDTHAEVLRGQRAALLGDWHGPAAEEAARRLDALAARIEKISDLAHAGQRAAQDAADALAEARAAMPPPPAAPPAPPSGPTLPSFAPGSFSLPPAPEPFSLQTAPSSFAPAPFTLPSAPAPMTLPQMPTNNTGTAGFSFFFGVTTTDTQKAQAVRAMQTYESSLAGSSKLIDDARGNVPPPAPTPAPQPKTGVPWKQLVKAPASAARGGGAAMARGMATSFPTAAPTASTPAQLQPGMRAGVLMNGPGPMIAGAAMGAETQRGTAQNGMVPPPAGQRGGDDDQEHENQMPTLDHGLFNLDERACPSVIGEEAQQ